MAGWFENFVSNPIGTLSNTVSDFIQSPSQSIGQMWNSGGKTAAELAALYYGGNALLSSGTAGGAANAASEMSAYPTSGIVGNVPAAATGSAGISGLGTTLSSLTGLSPTSLALLGSGALNYLGSQGQANAAQNAAQAQANAAQTAQAQQQANFNLINQQQAPVRSVGYSALNTLGSMLPGQNQQYDAKGNPIGTVQGTGALTQTFGPEQLKSNLAPNYQFMLSQGLGAQNQAMNVGGGGSNINRAGTKFAEDYASNAYQNAFNNFQNQQTNIYNRLAGIAGLGQQGQSAVNAAGTNATNAIGQLGVGAAGVLGSGQIGAANANATGLANLGNTAYLTNLMGP